MSEYHPDIPNHCLPLQSLPGSNVIYRAIGITPEVTSEDLLSHAELGKSICDPNTCIAWGLSVWTKKEDVEHARGIIKYLARQYVVKGEVNHNEGCLKQTPSGRQPNHHTFWKKTDISILNTPEITHAPMNGGNQ